MQKVAGGVAAAFVVLVVMPLLLFAALVQPPAQACLPGTVEAAAPAAVSTATGLSADQLQHAVAIVAEGRRRGIPDQGIVIALAAALQESGLRVYANDGLGGDLAQDQQGITRSLRLPHDAVGTDHGSLGIFQQQWPWWGSMAQLMNPAESAGLFYTALLRVPQWQSLPVTVAAQAVQRSAYPDAYADDEPLARRLLADLGSGLPTIGADCTMAAGGSVVVYPLPAGSGYTDLHNFGDAGSHWSSWHTGTDLSVPCGTPVLAAHDGVVRILHDQPWAGPWLVQVQTAPGGLTTWYAHMQRVIVADGATVTAGQQIGEVGDLGNATGCHLHFEVHPHGGSIYEDPVDPSRWLATHVGKPLGSSPFRVASFNVLGDSHTRPGGEHPAMASGTTRIRWTLQLLDARHIEIAGLQEFQPVQARTFKAAGGSTWATFHARSRTANGVAWRRTSWQLVRSRLVPVPYFDGRTQPMPLVLLRNRRSGQFLWVFNVHNPATTRDHHAQERWRDAATAVEIATLRSVLGASSVPLLFTGDFNEHHEAYCRLTATGLLTAAPGGSNCRRTPWQGIDWVFGTSQVDFSDWVVDRSALVQRTTDHPMVYVTARTGPVV